MKAHNKKVSFRTCPEYESQLEPDSRFLVRGRYSRGGKFVQRERELVPWYHSVGPAFSMK